MGGLIIPLITTMLIGETGWPATLQLLAVTSLILLVPLNFLILRFEPPGLARPPGAVKDQRGWTSRDILTNRRFWLPVMGLTPINAAFGGVQFNLGAEALLVDGILHARGTAPLPHIKKKWLLTDST